MLAEKNVGNRLGSDLGTLVDPLMNREDLKIKDQDSAKLVAMLEKMILIRVVEQKIAECVLSKEINCPCHLSVGQEGPAVGISQHLTSKDRAFGNHRSHAHYLAMGGSVDELIAEIYGKATGCSKGMGGSMHLYAGQVGFHGSVPIVAGTVPLAVGAALSAKLEKSSSIGVAFFGDGACEEGVVHESLNIASVMNLPMLFVVENNLYSSHLDINLRQPSDSTARFADANRIAYSIVDGNDVIAVEKAAASLINNARAGGGPGFLEIVTYRWLGHVGGSTDIDVGVRRSLTELENWKKRDPIQRLHRALKAENIFTDEMLEACTNEITSLVDEAIVKAKAAPWPQQEQLYNVVYSPTSVS